MGHLDYLRALLAALDVQDAELQKAATQELDCVIFPQFMPSDGRCRGPTWDDARRRWADHEMRLRETGTLDPFREAIGAGGENARAYAATALGVAKEGRALPLLVQALHDESPRVRAAAAQAMGSIADSSTFDVLSLALKDPDTAVRSAAAYSLSCIKDQRAVAPLLELLSSRIAHDRQSALFALANILDDATLPVIRAHLQDKSKSVRKFAQGALAAFDTKRRNREAGGPP